MKKRIILVFGILLLAMVACKMDTLVSPAVVPTEAATIATSLPTSTLEPTRAPTATITPTDIPTAAVIISSSEWTLKWYPAADKDRGDGTTFHDDAEKWVWRKVIPQLWPAFPNVPNPLVPEFRVVQGKDGPEVPDGLEYAMPESNFCQQLAGEACRVPVAAEHYHYFTGDYDVPNIGSCEEGGSRTGCMLVIVNVGRVTSDFTGVFGQGFRLHARYFNGNALDMAIWAIVSHGSNNMLNLDSKLNPAGIQNAGANCSVPEGCEKAHIRVAFVSGNEIMLILETTTGR
jgi:hypothetical protein